MTYEREIKEVENTLRSNFASMEDRLYWENKLADLKQKQHSAEQNQKYFNTYEKGVKAYKDTRGW